MFDALSSELCKTGLIALAHPGRDAQTARWVEDIQAHALITVWRTIDDAASWDTLETWLASTGLDRASVATRFHPIWSQEDARLRQMYRCFELIWLNQMIDARALLEVLHEHESLDVLCMYAEMLFAIYSDNPDLRLSMISGVSPWPVPRHTTTFELWYNRGLQAMDDGAWHDARVLLRRAVALRPGLSEGWHQLAVVHRFLGQPELCVQSLERARWGYAVWRTHHPDDPFWSYWLASVSVMSGDHDLAIELLTQAIELAPAYRLEAQQEPDFEPLFNNPAFLSLVGLGA